jgi:sugar-phosphatase
VARPIQAVVFDMDGVLIDSEPMWRGVEREVFARVGVHLSEADMLETTGVRVDQVVDHWYRLRPWRGSTPHAVEVAVVDGMAAAIEQLGTLIDGAAEALDRFRALGLGLALASSSPYRLIRAVLALGGIADRFDVVYSAEEEERGKPDPGVYLTAARRLGVEPARCLAVEDSPNGVLAATAAGMTCVAIVPEPTSEAAFTQAHLVVRSIHDLDDRVWGATGTCPKPR